LGEFGENVSFDVDLGMRDLNDKLGLKNYPE